MPRPVDKEVDRVGGTDDLVAWARERASILLEAQLPRRWSHLQGVADRALVPASMFSTSDGALLAAAAGLHDVGYSPEIATTGFHPLDGARVLRDATTNTCLVALVLTTPVLIERPSYVDCLLS